MPARIMGVLNVTPDSFSDGGRWLDHAAAIAHGNEMIDAGAAIIDIGGESTRPGAAGVSVDEELARVLPVVKALAPRAQVSIDTMKAEVARAALAAGASILNDVSASLHAVAAEAGAGWVAMHMQGNPRTMQQSPTYSDVVEEVADFLFERAAAARNAGVAEVFIDPGIGFGKTVEHNLELLRHLSRLTDSDFPVVVGTSRKTFLGALTAAPDNPPPTDRLEASLTTAVWASMQGAQIVRVHDVLSTARSLRVLDALVPERSGVPQGTVLERTPSEVLA